MATTDPLMTVQRVARALGVSPASVQRLIQRQKIRAFRGHPDLGSPWMVRRSDMLRYLKNRAGASR
ncbi:MAG: helix-turn-helix domain-containing protein [Methanomicrobiaceae archaeon]|nr:helix-turn-helix domain-containing protein [Methanomicrobiaceae archaeon]